MSNAIEWVHFGGCINDRVFNERVLNAVTTNAHGTVPIEYVTLYRRGVAFLVQEWASLADRSEARTTAETRFLESWCPGPDVFQQAGIVFTNVVLDNLYRRQPVIGRGSLSPSPVPFDRVIHNFPLEPPAPLTERFVVADATDEDIVSAWDAFFARVTQPVVVCLLFCTRNRMPYAYPEHVYRNLYALQESVRPVFERHDNAVVLEVDELIDCTDRELYKDHHHLTPAGDAALRAALVERLTRLGVIDRLLTRPHAAGLPFSGCPDRADFIAVDDGLVDFCAKFYRRPLLIGPDRMTAAMVARLEELGSNPLATASMAALPPAEGIDGVIYLKWTQHKIDPPWLKMLRTGFPDAFIELVSHWRQNAVVSAEESAFAGSVRSLAGAEGVAGSGLWSIADRAFRRYVVRLLANELFSIVPLADFDFERCVPAAARPVTPGAGAERLYREWKALTRSNLFGSSGRMASTPGNAATRRPAA